MRPAAAFPLLLAVTAACSAAQPPSTSFRDDAALLRSRGDVLLLHSGTGSFVVAPQLQGRVMTSTLGDDQSLGFVNHALVRQPPASAPFLNFGGEDRFWIGPEGGAYALYFAPGQEQVLANWQVPADLNQGAFRVLRASASAVEMQRDMQLRNRLGTAFELRVTRRVEAPPAAEVERLTGGPLPPAAQWVAFRSVNQVENRGGRAWARESGLPCIWILSMFRPGPRAFVIAPFRAGAGGDPVQTAYFGPLAADRLRRGSNFVLFRADAQYRSKIGLYAEHAQPVLGAYDPDTRVLTLVQYGPLDRTAPYVNELWNPEHPEPYHGDVANSYNHGGPEPFFELESSSPALELAPGQSHEHVHTTVHLRLPDAAALARTAQAALGVRWDEVVSLAGW